MSDIKPETPDDSLDLRKGGLRDAPEWMKTVVRTVRSTRPFAGVMVYVLDYTLIIVKGLRQIAIGIRDTDAEGVE